MLAALVGTAHADNFTSPLTSTPPQIDGKIETCEWATATSFDGFGRTEGLVQQRAQAWVSADEKTLYFAVRTQTPDEGSLISEPRANLAQMFWSDDTVDVHINPIPNDYKQLQYQLLVNHLGYATYRVHELNNAQEDPGWDGGWQKAIGFRNGYWEFECAVPISSMSAVKKVRKITDGVWVLNLSREWKGPTGAVGSIACQTLNGGFSAGGPHLFQGLPFMFTKAAPAVGYSVGSDPFLSDFSGTLSLYNPTNAPMELDASIVIDRDRMPEIRQAKKFTLAPGARESLVITCPKDDATTAFDQRILVTSADGKTVYYDRATKWPRTSKLVYKGGDVVVKKAPLKLDFAYYPYTNKMRIAIDISGLPSDAKLAGLSATVREAGGKTVKVQPVSLDGFDKAGKQELEMNLPPLKGQYELVLSPRGTNAPAAIVKPFERTVYEWEHNTLGLSDKVYAPFTPIKVVGNTLSTVLRNHTLNGLGLLDQITGESANTGIAKPMLASPMRYVARVDGKPTAIQAGTLRVVSAKQNEVTTETTFTAGALRASSKSLWDYDGTVKVELTLQPSAGKTVDELTLEIPFNAETGEMIHANADRIRVPVARQIPEGKGIVWSSKNLGTLDWPRLFCPYVFVGNAVRGLSWFAENDQGWLWDSATPNMELVRTGKNVVLRIHLVNKPTVITEPRTITFGMLAAPVKPRLAANSNPNSWRYRYARDHYSLLGTDINWFALGNCAAVYPAGKDMFLWEAIARGNKEQAPDSLIQEVIERGSPYFAPYPDWLATFKHHVGPNLRNRQGKKMVFYYNRASYQACEEFETFKDEWSCDNLRTVEKGNGIGEIKVVPTQSYLDYCMYWYTKSFEVGNNKGVYWDNMFIVPTRNTEMTDAYESTDGSVIPASGFWELRDLVKRTFVMMNERGMLPITFPHMTSFNPLPIMSFSTVQYDWEWQYSRGEVQDRFTREYIKLATTGELSGVWPVLLGDHGPQENDQWIQRTFRAVRLVHELDGDVPQPILNILDDPTLQVYRYWDDRTLPVTTGNRDIPTVVYSVPGKEAIAVVVSYSEKDEEIKLKIHPTTLGLGTYTVTDTEKENSEPLPVKGNAVKFSLKKHDMIILKIAPKGDK